jgi:transcriptional repressor NF-X1
MSDAARSSAPRGGRRGGRGGGRGRGRGRGGPAADCAPPVADSPVEQGAPAPQRGGRGGRGRGRGGGAAAGPQRGRGGGRRPGAQVIEKEASQKRKPEENMDELKEDDSVDVSEGVGVPEEESDEIELSRPQKTQLTEEIVKKLNNDAYECMICYDVISRKAQTWSCTRCFVIFHLACMSKWIKESYSEENGGTWRCPACQMVRKRSQIPKQYRCFCGKHVKPEQDRHVTPHACSETCGKKRGKGCPHPCVLVCHPGPCPPCNVPGKTRKCCCGRTEYQLLCGEFEKERRVCESTCRKLLNCKTHTCKQVCHRGDCAPCEKVESQTCFCGKLTEDRPCGSGVWVATELAKKFNCRQICGKLLSCGHHTCQEHCHQGPCPDCPRMPSAVTKCYCGKTSVDNLARGSCADPLPSCNQACDKLLDCKVHRCEESCHEGHCKPCSNSLKRPCLCGRNMITISCKDYLKMKEELEEKQGREVIPELQCNHVCKDMLACGSHRCGRTCCPGQGLDEQMRPYHRCNRVCGRSLTCGNHTCGNLCHLGYCPPCSVMLLNGISCACGASRINRPVPCGTKPPPCQKSCGKARECGHACFYKCHPGECPPCVVLTSKLCLGGHTELKSMPCSTPRIGCGRPCGKMRKCNVHACRRLCHDGDCDQKNEESTCDQVCLLKRNECNHSCKDRCHAPFPCPQVRCKDSVTIKCKCGRLSKKVECGLGGSVADMLSNPPPSLQTLPCDDICEVQQRNKALAEALQIPQLRQK